MDNMKRKLDINPIYYNYVYLDPRKPGDYDYEEFHFDYEPFYIGKGSCNRIYFHLYEKIENTYNKKKFNKIQKICNETGKDPIILKIYDNLPEQMSLDLEYYLIKTIGRNDLKLGPLTNLTDGGDNTNWISFNVFKKEEIRKKCKLASSGKNNPMYGKSVKDIWIKKYGIDVANDMWNTSNKNRSMNGKNKGTKIVIQSAQNDVLIKRFNSLTEASNLTGINISCISGCCQGYRKSAGGSKWRYEKIENNNE